MGFEIEKVEFLGSVGTGMKFSHAYADKHKIEMIGSEFIKIDDKFLIPMSNVQQMFLKTFDFKANIKSKIKKALEE